MSDANQLYSLLQIGTSRAAGLRPAALPPELESLVPGVVEAEPESRLWLSLAAWSLWSRAGQRPASASAATSAQAAPTESLRTCPPGAEALLARLLQGGHKNALLREWLRELKRYGGRLPVRFLPNLLTLATRQAELRADVAPVLGERGQWLSRLEPDWAWIVPAGGQDERKVLWETGTLEQRQAALAQWRAADPGAAREALLQAWPLEAPEARVRLLACLSIELGHDDEAFLENALDDRRKEVRTAAQALLMKLPGSALRRRMQARAEPLLGQGKLEISLPQSIDKAAMRDGVGAGPHLGLGEKAGWLVDLLAATDPRVWSERWQIQPTELLQLAARSDFAHALVRGWSSAAVRCAAPLHELADWIDALLRFWLSTDDKMRNQYPRDFFVLFARMAPADLHAWLAGVVGASRSSWDQQERNLIDLLVQAAGQSGAVWPAPLSREVIERLLRELPPVPAAQWELKAALDSLASSVDPEAVAGVEAGWQARATPEAVHDHIAHFFDIVRLRREMSLSFQEPT